MIVIVWPGASHEERVAAPQQSGKSGGLQLVPRRSATATRPISKQDAAIPSLAFGISILRHVRDCESVQAISAWILGIEPGKTGGDVQWRPRHHGADIAYLATAECYH